jgi:regulator-associated protein of mTOR
VDGIVRLFRNYDPTLEQGPLQMVSSFRALNEIIQMQKGSGLVLDWKQSTGSLLVGGDSRVIKVWDAQTETQILVRTAAQNLNLFFLLIKAFFFR